MEYIYFVERGPLRKIGMSKNPTRRIDTDYKQLMPLRDRTAYIFPVKCMRSSEKELKEWLLSMGYRDNHTESLKLSLTEEDADDVLGYMYHLMKNDNPTTKRLKFNPGDRIDTFDHDYWIDRCHNHPRYTGANLSSDCLKESARSDISLARRTLLLYNNNNGTRMSIDKEEEPGYYSLLPMGRLVTTEEGRVYFGNRYKYHDYWESTGLRDITQYNITSDGYKYLPCNDSCWWCVETGRITKKDNTTSDNPVLTFLNTLASGEHNSHSVYESYVQWCECEGHKPVPKNKMTSASQGSIASSKRKTINGNKHTMWVLK